MGYFSANISSDDGRVFVLPGAHRQQAAVDLHMAAQHPPLGIGFFIDTKSGKAELLIYSLLRTSEGRSRPGQPYEIDIGYSRTLMSSSYV
jgi:hypothetical protein